MTLLARLLLTFLTIWTAPAYGAANKAPSASIVTPATGAVFSAPATVTISASASDTDGTISRVEFYQGTTLLGTLTKPPYTLVWGNVAGGSYSLTVKAIDNAGATKTSSAVSITVTGPKAIISSPSSGSVVYSNSVIVSGSFFGDANTTVLVDNGNTSRVAVISGNSFSATLPVQIGLNTLRAVATRRDKSFDQAVVTVTGNAAPLLVFTSPGTATFNAPATVPFTVDAISPSRAIAKVEFLLGGTVLGSSTTPPYQYTWSSVPAGNYTMSARATDDNAVVSTASLPIVVNGPNAPPVVALTSPANGTAFVAPANVPLSASATDPDGTISLVEFLQNGNVIGTTNLAPYAMTWSNVPAGSYSMTARATDNRSTTSTSAGINIVVGPPNRAPVVTLTSPSSGSTYTAPATISIAASASDSDGTVTKVEFYEGATLIGAATTAPYTLSWLNVGAGTYNLSAKATDNSGAVASSGSVGVTVSANAPPTVTLTLPDPRRTYYAPANIVLAARAADSDGTVARVDFYQGSTLIGTATTSPYSVNWNNVGAGTYSLTAKAVDNRGASTTSNAISISVTALSIIITDPVDGATNAGDDVTVSGTIDAPPYSGVTVNGAIAAIEPGGRFYATGVPLATGVNTIIATLTTPDGQTRTQALTLSSSGPGPVKVRVTPTQGLAPLPVAFSVTAPTGITIRSVEIDGDSNGTIDYSMQGDPWSATLTFGGTGTTIATVRVTDTEGNVYTTRTPIVLYSEAVLDQTSRAVWSGVTNALASGSISGTAPYMSGPLQQRYASALDTLRPYLPQIVASFSDLHLVSLSTELGEYAVNRVIDGENRIYFIYFGRDGDGVWRLQSM